jgi:two-component system OmpR family sensor kinase
MFKTLYARLAFALALLLIAVGAVVAGFAVQATGMFIQELDQRFNRDLARALLVQGDMAGGERLDEQSVHQLFSHYMHINPAIEIYLLDLEGNIVAFAAPEQKIKRKRVDLAPVKRFLHDDALPILGDDPRDRNRKKIFSAAAFPLDGPPRQYLYVVLGGEAFDSVRNLIRESYLARFSLTAVAGVVLFGMLAGALAFHLLTRRLRRLAATMETFRRSGFREHKAYTGSGGEDEIDRLGDTFNEMAERIIEQMKALEQKDALRRNLVANVSHDLRTPLTALQGYLETLMLKGGELPPEQRRRYLETTFRQSERLTRLVGELFELAKLDARETPPALEPVAVGELLYDTGQQFRPRSEAVGIALQTHIARNLPLIQADIPMLSRAVENLVSNALDHTPEGGVIRLEAAPAGDGVRVAISNSGDPIDGADIPHLFERFYQAPERRTGRGAGLGLAVVKRIVELHGSTVRVESSSAGTTFSFALQPCGPGQPEAPVTEK